jgi:RHH-type proline utilization regulon transcriptional repressor/proline dehydrogenase/delta 1-pyrroline-5-carboxylate dehydrogenase
VFSQVDPQSELAQRELFGPVLAVISAPDFSSALQMANATPYALTGGLYSRTPSHIQQARQDFAVGNLYINREITGALVERQPFGGFKLSGVGSKAGGPDYLLQFLEPRTVTENTQRQGFAPIEGS